MFVVIVQFLIVANICDICLSNEEHTGMGSMKRELVNESNNAIPAEYYELLRGYSDEVTVSPKDPIIDYGEVDPDVYIVKEGTMAVKYFDDSKERLVGFASTGTILVSPHSYCMGKPSFVRIDACNKCTLLHIPKSDFDNIVRTNHDFAVWMYSMAMEQIYVFELKLSLFTGTAKERYISMFRRRPDIISSVPMKMICMYLDITPSYLCRIRRELMMEESRDNNK